MKQYRLLGFPLGHSLSPQIHQKLFSLENIPAHYELFSFPPESLETQIAALKELAGFNVTIPYKCSILSYLDELHESAQLYQSVNTVKNVDGRLVGYNTDCVGFLNTMQSHRIQLQTDVCVVGAGGVGRMFAIECVRQGAEVTLAVRDKNKDKALFVQKEVLEKLGKKIEVCAIDSLDRAFGLLINATPVGMFPLVDACPVSEAQIKRCAAVFDCVYNPAETLLMQKATQFGVFAVGGMGMLVWQAAIAHEYWNGTAFSNTAMAVLTAQMNALLKETAHE